MASADKPQIRLGDRLVSADSEPYVIAEIGVNHEGSLDKAKKLIELAKEGGADAAKFQTYKAKKLASKNSPSYWDLSKEPTTSQRTLFEKYDCFEQKDYLSLAGHCQKNGIDFLSTPFDDDAVGFLKDLVPFYKVASADITTLPFLKKIGRTGKSVVLSTGASTLKEVRLAVNTLREAGASHVALLHCILNYPTPFEQAHLNMIKGLVEEFPECVIGYSDHTVPEESMLVLCTAYLKGARILEKHFTYDKSLPGNDHYHAMDVGDLLIFKKQMALIRKIEGQRGKEALASEQISRSNARRSLVLQCPVKAGQRLTEMHLTYKRPGTGISPAEWDHVLGLKVNRDLDEDSILQWDDLDRSS